MIKQLQDLPVEGKKVLVRVDFNVPMAKDGMIRDDSRILAALPTIKTLLSRGAKVVLMSHLGRPQGPTPSCSLEPCAERLKSFLGHEVRFAKDCIGPEAERAAAGLEAGGVLLLENLRFYEAEEHPEKDPSFAKQLAHLGDFYVNDAFGTAHRAHSSTVAIASYFPGKSAAGLLMMKEVRALGDSLLRPKRPFVAIIGGAKISTKLGVLRALLKSVDTLLIGGAMAYTFMGAQGVATGASPVEKELFGEANRILEEARRRNKTIGLPADLVVAAEFRKGAVSQVIAAKDGIPSGFQGMDIGPQTVKEWEPTLRSASTVFWNGPLGVFEFPSFAGGTQAIAQVISGCRKAFSVVGGGDSIAALEGLGLLTAISHVSTGGGASLEFIEQGTLPGLQALDT